MDYKKISSDILNKAKAMGANEAEVYVQLSEGVSIEIKDNEVDSFEGANEHGIGLRVFSDNRLGFSYTTDFDKKSLDKLIQEAIKSAANTYSDRFNALPSLIGSKYADVNIFDDKVVSESINEKIEKARQLEGLAKGYDKRITKVRKASVDFSVSELFLFNSREIDLHQKSTSCSASIMVVAEDKGEAQMAWDYASHRFYNNLNIKEVAETAGKRAVDQLGAQKISSCKTPVILSDNVASEFLGVLAGSFSADSVLKNKSLLKDKKGERLFSELVSIIDDGLIDGMTGSSVFDGEGVPVQKKALVEKGVLKGYLHNVYTAKRTKEAPTGNGMRGGFKGIPNIGITNLFIEKGSKSLEELISGVDEGIYITEAMGMHTANPISGDFSVGAVGFYIKGGKLSYPVREIAIAGNILELFNKVDAIGSDLRFYGKIGAPSLRINELSISGK